MRMITDIGTSCLRQLLRHKNKRALTSRPSDRRFEPAEMRGSELQSPAVGVEHVLDDRQAEAGAAAAFVETAAAHERGRSGSGIDTRPIIADGK